MKILVIGATGMLGEPVARELQADGYNVSILSRNVEKARTKFGSEFTIVQGDVQQPESLRAALAGMDGVHITLSGGPKPEDYERIEHQGTSNVAQAAAEAGVQRITYLSGFSVNETNRTKNYQTAAKYGAETAVTVSGVPYTIFRATWFMESLPLFIQNGRALIIGKPKASLHWLAAQDYAQMVSKAYRTPESANKTLHLYGPEAFTFADAIKQYQAVVRPDTKLSHIPLWLLSLLATLTRSASLKDEAQFMKYMEEVQEVGSPDEANELLGTPITTLTDWCRAKTAVPPFVYA
jgi:uncharacterized protein YbjT (DUF2867 family)